ncbi:MAG: chemotaxis response regulator protein-glutamate methylesterase [Carboxydocellales bacterium]
MNGKIRVLIVEDSAFMRQFISNIISTDHLLEVIGAARHGAEGLALTQQLKPDVITMDIEMPVMDGLTAVEKIMALCPTPIVMLSSLTTDGADATIKALELGAVDFIPKPSGSISIDLGKVKGDITEKIKIAAKAKISSHLTVTRTLAKVSKPNFEVTNRKLNKIIAIGTSTGGPKALQEILPLLPRSLPAGVLIVQHMPKGFTKSLADRLDSMSQINVREAKDGDELVAGLALIAPGDFHMTTNEVGGRVIINLNQEPAYSGHRPSVDVMFKTVAKLSLDKVGVILTGMGGDGSDGLVLIKQNMGKTIAQNEDSCIVFGMPKVAIEKKAVDNIVPLNKIAMEIMKLI